MEIETSNSVICSVCEHIFEDVQTLVTHIRGVHFESTMEAEISNSVNCSVCTQTFEGVQILVSHLREVHEKIETFKKVPKSEPDMTGIKPVTRLADCENCKKIFPKNLHYYLHFQHCCLGKDLTCYLCSKEVTRFDNLIKHYVFQHKSYVKELEALDKSNGDLKSELSDINFKYLDKIHLIPPLKPSEFIPKKYEIKKGKKRPSTLFTKCEYCNYKFAQKVDYYLHYQNCSSGQSLKCYICNKDVKKMSNLILHYKGKHKEFSEEVEALTQTQGIKSEIATLNLKYLQAYQEMEKINLALYQYKCKNCLKTFRWRTDCLIHEEFCKCGTKSMIPCWYCNEELKNDTSLIDHYKKEHRQNIVMFLQKSNQSAKKITKFCEKCKTAFSKELTYELHYHSCFNQDENMPNDFFKCHICQKVVKKICSLSAHYRQHHIEYTQFCMENVQKLNNFEPKN